MFKGGPRPNAPIAYIYVEDVLETGYNRS
jgi:hypothetical protein